jgi:predicted acylesterase/phospholipase RssA
MSNSRFRRLVNLKKIQHEASNSTKSSGEHIGDYIGSIPSATLSRRGLHDHCWESKGETREKYCELLPQIKTFLETCLKVTSSSDIVMSFYMIGPNPMNASPTVTLISEDTSSRQSAKKLLKKSEILSHNGFKVISLSRDPGVQRMKRLASGDAEHSFLPRETKKSYLTGKVVHQVLQDTSRMEYDTVPKSTFSAVLGTATEVFINPSQPFNSSSTLIYVRHGATFRPATAFPMSVGSKIYLRTVQHAFMQGSTSSEEYVSDLAECGDIDVDYDSDEDLDGLDDVDVAMTSIGSQSPDNWSDSGSDTDSSFKSQPTSGRSTPCFDQNAFQESDSMVQGLRLASADLAAFESGVRNFSLTKIAQPDKRELVSVGKLIDSSVDLDCALIEATSDYLKAQLNQALDEASGTVARKPQESTAIVAYTSSRGSLNGLISATPSLLRLPGARQLQAVYTIRLDGPLADGDCGSAVRDQRSKSLYGHIVSGCPTTGTAYVLAAHQVQSYVNRISAHLDVRAFNVEEDQTQPYYPRSVVSSASQHAEQLTCVGFGRQPTIWQEARATSIAPKYFPPITIEGIKFVDSAISANNPSAKNWQLDESDLSSVNTKELEQHVESSFVAEKNYGSSSSLSIIDTAKILICVVRIIYKESKKGPSDDRQRLVHSRLLSDMIRMLNVGSDIDVESLSLELLEIDKASGNDSDTSLYRHLFNRARRWSWIIRVLASILALSPTIGFILTRVLAYIHFATLVYLTILGLLVNAGIPTRRYDIVGESNQGLDPGKSFGIKSLDIAILMLAGIENTSEMTALFPTKVTRSKNRGNNQILMTIRNRYKLPAKHNQNVSSRRVLFLLGQAILCLLPIIPGLFLGYVGFFTPRDRERRPVISLLCDAWSFGTVLCCINVTFLGFQTIHWVFQNAPFRGRLSRREKLGIFHAFVTHACGVLHSLTKLGSRIVVVATMQSMSSITTSTLPYGASDRKIPEGLNGNSLYQSFDLVVFLIATEIIFYSDFARRMSALSKLGIIAFTTAVLSFQWCFWGYFSFSDASIALLTGSMFATSSVNGSHIVMWAASFTQMLLAFLVSTATVRSLMRARRYILLGILLG